MTRTFEDSPAVMGKIPLIGGLMGPSGGGKTFSALRLATGIVKVTGGEIYFIDTEAGRALHYARDFKFRHVPFSAPFCPLDYLAAIEHCAKRSAGAIIVDSMSHEHEGPGGVLEQHASECDRLAREWSRNGNRVSESAVNFPAWAEPKARRRRLLNSVVQLGVSTIFCFRAKEKSKPVKRGDMVDGERQEKAGLVDLGWMPIAGDEFVYEMGFNLLLEPGSDGVPNLFPAESGTKRMAKLPGQFRRIIDGKRQLDEATGEALARWASGEHAPAPGQKTKGNLADALAQIAASNDLAATRASLRAFSWTQEEGRDIQKALGERKPSPDDDGR